MILLEVAVAAPIRQTYTYALPASMSKDWLGREEDLIGRRVFIPFGSGKAAGYILSLAPPTTGEDSFVPKNIIELIDTSPIFSKVSAELFKWVADYYHHPIGKVIKTALPPGLSSRVTSSIRLTNKQGVEDFRQQLSGPETAAWVDQLLEQEELSAAESGKILKNKQDQLIIQRLLRMNLIEVRKYSGADRVGVKKELCYRLDHKVHNVFALKVADHADPVQALVASATDCDCKIGQAEARTIALIYEMSRQSGCLDVPRRELRNRYPYGATIAASLVDKGLVETLQKRVYRSPFGEMLPRFDQVTEHTPEQIKVLKEIKQALKSNQFAPFLLHGVTGSGKTEVYLEVAETALSQNRAVLVLVPEIALATQIEAHFVSRFAEQIAVLHSGLSTGERFDEWSRIQSGAAKIVIGARSAVFAPVPNLGLIVVDEEHDASFKQEDGLRYNGRDVALVRGRLEEAVVLLGSATPAVTSYHHGKSGKYRLLEMPSRVWGTALPEVEVIDLKKQDAEATGGLFHACLRHALIDTFEKKEQAILLLNRRGYSTSVICQDCGTMVECRHCKVTMNLHKKRRRLLCHYCGFQLPENIICAACGSGRMVPLGFGTERVAAELAEFLPQARIARLDSDIAANRKVFLEILNDMRAGHIDILVGTQMIAKGLHFPRVTLVGIVLAESGLAFPDFRAAEKTYQLIAQVTGRAGRGEKPGRVYIQTLQPEHYAIRLAAGHDYGGLVEREIAIRKMAGFPPFARLVFILIESPVEKDARETAVNLAQEARILSGNISKQLDLTVLGPAPAAIERIKDQYRWQVMLKSTSIPKLHHLLEELGKKFKSAEKKRIIFDVDPESML